jgi:ABC-2 type transport system permease protein
MFDQEAIRMSELTGIYAIWYREIRVYFREKSRIVASIINPLLFLTILGGGLGSVQGFGAVGGQMFLFPAILGMSLLFTSIFFGLYIVWDRKVDFLKEVLVAPISRLSMFIGKIFGGATDALIQATLVIVIGAFLGIHYTLLSLPLAYGFMFLTTVSLVSFGLIFGSLMESPEGFQLISSFIVFPMFLLSMFPFEQLPSYLVPFAYIDPMTYAVDALRGVILNVNHFPLYFDAAILAVLAVVFVSIGTYSFKKMKI